MAIVDEGQVPDSTPEVQTPAPVVDNSAERLSNLEGMFGRMEGIIQGMASTFHATQQQQSYAPPEVDVSDEELEATLQNGSGAKNIRRAARAEVRGVADRLGNLENVGLTAIANLTRDVAVASMPYYKKYKTEIDAYINQLPIQSRLDGAIYTLAHDAVVGKHTAEIAEETRQATIRSFNDNGGAQSPGASGRAVQREPAVSVSAEFGEESAQALRDQGNDEDSFAKKLGYSSFADYVEKTKKYR